MCFQDLDIYRKLGDPELNFALGQWWYIVLRSLKKVYRRPLRAAKLEKSTAGLRPRTPKVWKKSRTWPSRTLSRVFSGKEKEHRLKLLGLDIFQWGGGLPREKVGGGEKL